MHEGDSVAVLVAVRDEEGRKEWYFEVRYGTVVNPHPYLPGTIPNYLLAWFQLGDVSSNLEIFPGDSGSPVFAFINGTPVIIGVARAALEYIDPWTGEFYYMSYFTRIDDLVPFTLEKNSK